MFYKNEKAEEKLIMRERRLFMILGIILAVLALGIAYAATLSIGLSITGSATAMASEENFDVKFTEVSDVTGTGGVDTKGSTAEIDSNDQTKGTFEFKGFVTKGQTQSATWTISNDNDAGLYADIAANSAIECTDGEYFRGTCDLASEVIEPNGTTTLTVTVECIKTPTIGRVTSGVMRFGFTATASHSADVEGDGGIDNPIIPPATCAHSYGDWTTTIAATCTTAGQKIRECQNCTALRTEVITALGHNWVNGDCSRCGIKCKHAFVDGTCTICGFVQGVYAILYSDGDMRFNTTGRLDKAKTEAGNTVLMQSEDIKSLEMTAATSQPWASNRTSITSVTIEEEIKPKNTAYWFNGCSKLKTINNISNLNTAEVTNMRNMFYGCSGLTTLDVTGFNTAKVTNMEEMFCNCSSLTTLDLRNWDVSKVTSMYNMFNGCRAIESIYLGEFNAVNVTHTMAMFQNCNNLLVLDISNFITSSKLTNASYMFNGCHNVQTIDLSKFNTTNVGSLKYMFHQCYKLTNVNLSSFNTAKVTDMQYMFGTCENLETINLGNFNTAKVTNMTAMFQSCKKLTLLDMRQATFDAVTNNIGMFEFGNNNIKVIVKDAGNETNIPKTWIQNRLGTGVGTVYTVSEWQAAGGE